MFNDLINGVLFQDGGNTHKPLVGAPRLEGLQFPGTLVSYNAKSLVRLGQGVTLLSIGKTDITALATNVQTRPR